MTAYQRLLAILDHLDQRAPCDADPRWTSEVPDDRALAVGRCLTCPVLGECRIAAAEMKPRAGVWGGRDYTRKPRNTKGSRP